MGAYASVLCGTSIETRSGHAALARPSTLSSLPPTAGFTFSLKPLQPPSSNSHVYEVQIQAGRSIAVPG